MCNPNLNDPPPNTLLLTHGVWKDPAEAATSFLKLRGLVKLSARRATAAELKAEGLPPEDPPAIEAENAETAGAVAVLERTDSKVGRFWSHHPEELAGDY